MRIHLRYPVFVSTIIVVLAFFSALPVFADEINIDSAYVSEKYIHIKGNSSIDPETSSYIQYYVGKIYNGTVTCCIFSNGFSVNDSGNFSLEIPLDKLRGHGRYEIVLEQNPKGNTILPPKHWIAFRKVDGKIKFGDITSMGEISNLALTVGMEISRVEVVVGKEPAEDSMISINSVQQSGDRVIVRGRSYVDRSRSTYIQYYAGKLYPGTTSNCILADGFHVSNDGTFELVIPVSSLKGKGTYELALEQNSKNNSILAPKHWVAVSKRKEGVQFGDIGSMGEISNLALTVGMELARTTFTVK